MHPLLFVPKQYAKRFINVAIQEHMHPDAPYNLHRLHSFSGGINLVYIFRGMRLIPLIFGYGLSTRG